MIRTFLLLFVLTFHANVFAQVTIDNLMCTPFPTNLVSSPDGKRIAWIFNDRGVRNVFGAEGPDFVTRKLTTYETEDGLDVTSLSWVSSDQLVFVKGAATNRQGESPNPLSIQDNYEQSVWTLSWSGSIKKIGKGSAPKPSPDGSKILFLSGGQVHSAPADGSGEEKKLFQLRGAQGSFRFSPDGSQLAFVSHRGDHSFIGLFDMKASTIRFLDPSVDFDSNPVWSEDGKQLACIRVPSTKPTLPFVPEREAYPWSIRIMDIETGKAKEVWQADIGRGSSLFEDLPAVDNILFWIGKKLIFPWEKTGWIHLYSIDAVGGEPKELTPGAGEVEHVSLTLDRKALLVVSNITDIDRRHIWKIGADGKVHQVTKGVGIEWAPAETSNGVICLRSDAVTAAWPYLVRPNGEMKMLAQALFPKAFPKSHLVIPEAVQISAKDGLKVPGQLFLPNNIKKGDKRPAVIFFHGGSRRQMLLGFNYGQYYHNAYAMNQYLANLGYIVLSVNYRSGIGYGRDFREALDYGATGASEYNDVVGAGEFLRQRSDVDNKRIGLWGGSYGGYLTALGLSRNSDMFACGVDIHGVHDWNPVIKNFVPSYDPVKLADFSRKAYESSPLNFVTGWKSPVLLIHGDDDRNVPFNETVCLVESLRKQNVYFEQLIFPDEIHSFLLHQSWVKAYKAAAAFFDQEFKKIK